MRIVILHNAYQQPGGEDIVAEAEATLLRSAGHDVLLEIVSNNEISGVGAKVRAALGSSFDIRRYEWAADIVRRTRADVVHVHNFFPLLTPAVHHGASAAGAAVVQTIHNFRLLCANGLLLRSGAPCVKCTTSGPLWGVVHRCYRGSAVASLAVTNVQRHTAKSQHWRDCIDRFIMLSEFGRNMHIAAGFPEARMVVKPNFVPDTKHASCIPRSGALYVGRLSSEKGAHILVDAWHGISDIPLRVIGDGPDRQRLEAAAPRNVTFAGHLSPEDVRRAMGAAQFLVVPSTCQEQFGLAVVEAFAAGLPVAASQAGALPELVTDGDEGVLFTPNDVAALRAAVKRIASLNLPAMSQRARRSYELRYSPTPNLARLESIYSDAVSSRRWRGSHLGSIEPVGASGQ